MGFSEAQGGNSGDFRVPGGWLSGQVSQGRAPEEESTGVVRGRLARGKSPREDRK